MKKLWTLLLVGILLCPYSTKAFESSGQCTILMDMDSHRILYGNNIHTVRSVASISKIMTAILAVESGKLNDEVEINDVVLDAYGSGIYIQVGEHMRLEDLVYGLMLRSGNDAALAIADYVGGSVEEFVGMMNKKAKEIGMINTTFHNPSGLDEEDEGNLSTAYDMAILTIYEMKNKTYQKIVKTKKYAVSTDKNNYVWPNKNKMLSIYPYCTGGKTGFTEIANRTLVSTASKDGLNLVVVTLNDGNDWDDHKNLYVEAYEEYANYQILKKGEVEVDNETYYLNYQLYLKNDFSYPLSEAEKNTIRLKFELEKKKEYEEDDVVGKVKVIVGDEEVHQDDVYIKNIEKEKESFFEKIRRWFKNLW